MRRHRRPCGARVRLTCQTNPGAAGLTGVGARVGGGAPIGGGLRGFRVSSRGNAGFAPAITAQRHEQLALLRRHPRRCFLRLYGDATLSYVICQPHESAVPADAHSTRPELCPALVVDVGDVLELQPGRAVRLTGKRHLDPADLAAELPGGGEALRPVAAFDRPARIALEVEPASHAQVSRHRQKPPPDPLCVSARVPQVIGRGRVALADGHDPRDTRFEDAGAELAPDGADLMGDFNHGFPPLLSPDSPARRRSRLPRATSVASASRCGVQVRRNRSSHASTSRKAPGLTAYMRLVPSGLTVAKPESRSTRRCCETAGWEIPNSFWIAPLTVPELCSPSAISSRILRRTGSPSTSNACTTALYQP